MAYILSFLIFRFALISQRNARAPTLTMESQSASPSVSSSSSNFKRGQSKVFYASDAVWDTGQSNQQQVRSGVA